MSDLSPAINSRLDSVSSAMDVMGRVSPGRRGRRSRGGRQSVFQYEPVSLSHALHEHLHDLLRCGLSRRVVARAIPRDNAAVRGVIEGAQAASRRADAMLRRDV